jgi:hypothetical protein
VDWVLTGTEQGFRYGQPGDDVWALLFRPLGPPPKRRAVPAVAILDLAFWGTGKDHLAGRALTRHRKAYHKTFVKWIEITNTNVRDEVTSFYERFLAGSFCIGVHRRVGNAKVANSQGDGTVPSIEQFLKYTNEQILASVSWRVFLATDDADAVSVFKQAFGERCLIRERVQRTTACGPEVHYREWGNLSIADAEDVLIDTLLLARCDVLVHTSSSISTAASLLNPNLRPVRVVGS